MQTFHFFKVGTTLSKVLSFLTLHHPIEQFLQNTSPSSPEIVTNYRYCPLLTIFPATRWHLDQSNSDRVLRDFAQDQEKLYISRWVVNASGRDAAVAHQLGAQTVKFDNLTAYYGLFTQIPDALRADPDHRSIIKREVPYSEVIDQVPVRASSRILVVGSKVAAVKAVKAVTTVVIKVFYDNDAKEEPRMVLLGTGIVTSMKMGSFFGDMIAEGLLIRSGKPLLLKLAAEFEAWLKLKDEGADANVDPAEVERMSMKMDTMPAWIRLVLLWRR
ncbi:hypothetical protein K435DRAFT_789065 [Dendrothele bispora CBS 962.96]|uniref:FAD/NAD(P)-binding domain-containing protein n=1 Tax=Dendrothele bispora (strain CBS 962.96) TaxID=1314807 RepID=A0A4S8MWW9_DENBC|nr:hypothetical protein K435DRAFT_789065 [Dendrothele bispora CBS 962.96]